MKDPARIGPVHTCPAAPARQAGLPLCGWNAFARGPWAANSGKPATGPIRQSAFDVSAEPMMEKEGEFIRHLASGPFHASIQVDYGDRASGE